MIFSVRRTAITPKTIAATLYLHFKNRERFSMEKNVLFLQLIKETVDEGYANII